MDSSQITYLEPVSIRRGGIRLQGSVANMLKKSYGLWETQYNFFLDIPRNCLSDGIPMTVYSNATQTNIHLERLKGDRVSGLVLLRANGAPAPGAKCQGMPPARAWGAIFETQLALPGGTLFSRLGRQIAKTHVLKLIWFLEISPLMNLAPS